MQLAHPRPVDIYVQISKHKGQNTEVTSSEHKTPVYKKQGHIRLPYKRDNFSFLQKKEKTLN